MPVCMLPGPAACHVFVLFACTSVFCRLYQTRLPAAMCSLATAKQGYSPLLQLAGFPALAGVQGSALPVRKIQPADHSNAIAFDGEPAWEHLARSLAPITE